MPSLGFNKATKQHKAPTMGMAVRIIQDVTTSREGDGRLAGKQQTQVLAGPRERGARRRLTMHEILRQRHEKLPGSQAGE